MASTKESMKEDVKTIETILKENNLNEDDMSAVMLAVGCIAMQATFGEPSEVLEVINLTSKYSKSTLTALMVEMANVIVGD